MGVGYSQKKNRKNCKFKMGQNCPADFIISIGPIVGSRLTLGNRNLSLYISATCVLTIALQCGGGVGLQSGEKYKKCQLKMGQNCPADGTWAAFIKLGL